MIALADTSILVRDYTSKNNPGLSFRLEILYRVLDTSEVYETEEESYQDSESLDDDELDEESPSEPYVIRSVIGKIDGASWFSESVSSEDEARAHAIVRDNPILVGPNAHLAEILEAACDRLGDFLANWEITPSNGRPISQKYYKAAGNSFCMVVSYVGNIAVDYITEHLFYTVWEAADDNPTFLTLDTNVEYDLQQYHKRHEILYSTTDYIPDPIDIPEIGPGQSSEDIEVEPIALPATITREFVVDAVTYKVRVTFTKVEGANSTTVTYKTDYGLTDYTVNKSEKSVTFVEDEYGDAPTYLESYALQEIELLKQFLAGNSLSPDLMVAGEGFVSYDTPQSEKNIGIKTDNPAKDSYYVPLVPYVDTSNYIRVLQVPRQTNTLTYDGATKTPVWSTYQSSQIEISGDTASTEAGDHYVILTLKPGYCWEDGTVVPRSVVWTVQKQTLTVPTVTNLSFVYTGEEQGPQISSYDTDLITVIHDKETAAGEYSLTFSVIPTKAHNYSWNRTNVVTWQISPKPVVRPTAQRLSLQFNRAEQTLPLTGFDEDIMDISGNTGTTVGPYTAEISLKDTDNYCWSTKIDDDDISPHKIDWTITIAIVPEIAPDTLTFVYDPDISHQITISNVSADTQDSLIEQIGTDTAIEAGIYTAKYSLSEPTQSVWDTGEDTIEVQWIIEPAVPKVVLSRTSVSCSDGTVQTVTVQRDGDGSVSAYTYDDRVCKAQVSGMTISITPTGIGETTILVRIDNTRNYIAAYVEISVTSDYIPPLNTLDPVQISTILKSNKDIPWNVGDYFNLDLSGTAVGISLAAVYRAVLIGIEHNKEREGPRRLHFAIAQDSGGTDIAFCDNSYLSAITGGQENFSHNNTSRSNEGGWEESNLRDILKSFEEFLPEELTEVLEESVKLTDIKAGGTENPSSVMPTKDKLWIPSEYELLGEISYSNGEEENCQSYYSYFADHLTRHQHNITGRVVDYWTRSPATDEESFVKITNNGSALQTSFVSLGIVPCFTISDGSPISLLDSVPWSRISQLMSEGRISEIAEVGDTKKIDDDRRATLISLDHNTTYEGANLAHFIIDKDKDDKFVAMIDYNYDVESTDTVYQQHQKTLTNVGGWSSSLLRDKLQDIYEELPEDLRDSIVPCRKYTDNLGNYNVPEAVTITRDPLFLLSEFEVFGRRTLANSKEQEYQEQYVYFQEHDPIYYSSLLKENKVSVWLRSPDIRSTNKYGIINTQGQISSKTATTSLGIIPGFTLGSATSSNILKDLSWGQISSLAAADNLRNYAQVGDTKQIHIDGTVGSSQIAQSFLAVLISLDHNTEVEGPNRAHFAIVRDIQDREIALYDNAQLSVNGLKTFSHNIQGNSNTGGWQLSNLRDICRDIYDSLEDDLKTAIVLQPKYTNNYGGSPDDLSQIIVSKTEDYVWIPSAKEFGAGLSYQENSSQEVYDYFTTHKEHLSHTTNDPIDIWTRTPTEQNTSSFVYVSKDGAINSLTLKAAKYSLGITPCFCVGMKSAQISLDDMTWQEIQYYVQNNLLSRLVKPGATKTVRLSGKINGENYTGTYKAVLLDINHNPEVEGELSAHFALCFSYNDDPIVFTDSGYETVNGKFKHQTSKTNAGGYSTSQLRSIFNQFHELLPQELKAAIRVITKVTNNNVTGITRVSDISLTITEDKIWTLSQIERSDESRDQQQSYTYFYQNLRQKYFRRHNSSDIAMYWLRNAAETQNDPYYYMAGKGAATLSRLADYSLGIIPCFAVL